MSKNPTVAPGINYQSKWENATEEDKKKGKVTKVTSLVYDEYDPMNRKSYNDQDKKI